MASIAGLSGFDAARSYIPSTSPQMMISTALSLFLLLYPASLDREGNSQ
jgi:hypothetical protein